MAKPLEVYLANTTLTPFTVLPPEEGDERRRVVLELHRWEKPDIRVTFDRYQWREVLRSLVSVVGDNRELPPLALTPTIG